MKVVGRYDWTRGRRAHVASQLLAEIMTETKLTRVRSLAAIARLVLTASADILDAAAEQYPALLALAREPSQGTEQAARLGAVLGLKGAARDGVIDRNNKAADRKKK